MNTYILCYDSTLAGSINNKKLRTDCSARSSPHIFSLLLYIKVLLDATIYESDVQQHQILAILSV